MAKEYSNGDITVVWKPDLCIHSENCVKGLPSVFDSTKRPWIDVKGASSDEIVAQVAKCPSGALSIKEKHKSEPMENKNTSIQVMADGPARVTGPCEVQLADGKKETIDRDVFLCRCGHSSNKPFCDGSHKKQGFVG